MAAVFDITEMKRRVAATGSRIGAAAQEDRQGSAQLLRLLEAVETTLVQDQLRIRRMEEAQGHALEEFQQLRTSLHDALSGPPQLLWRCLDPKSFAARTALIDRWEAIGSPKEHDGEKLATRGTAKAPVAARRRAGKVVAFCGFMGLLVATTFAAYEWSGDAANSGRAGVRLPGLSGNDSFDAAVLEPPPNPARQTDEATREANLVADSDWIGGRSEAGDPDARHGLAGMHQADTSVTEERTSSQARPGDTNGITQTPETEQALAATRSHGDEDAVSEWLEAAQRQIANLALTSPEGDNAYETYQLILSIQPNNQAALAGLERIGVKYVDLANLAAAKGDLRTADDYAAKAAELAPEHPLVQALAIPADATASTTGNETAPAVTLNDIMAAQRTSTKPREVATESGASTDPSGFVARENSTEEPVESIAGIGFDPTLDETLGRSLDAEIIGVIPLVVPIYPGTSFIHPNASNIGSRSHDHAAARSLSDSGGGTGDGAGGSSDGGTGDSGGGTGDSGGGTGDSGGGSSDGGEGPGNGNGKGKGHGKGKGGAKK